MMGAMALSWLPEDDLILNYPFPLSHRYIPVNPHGIGGRDDPVQDGIGKSAAAQSFMPAFWHKLGAEDRRSLTAPRLH